MRLEILNVRLGLATNSSSSHSIIFLKPGEKLRDDMAGQSDGEFGWDHFTAASRELRDKYVAGTLYATLNHMFLDGKDWDTEHEAAYAASRAIVMEWVGTTADEEGYVDHQSVYDLPKTFDGKSLHRGFFDAFREFLTQPGLAILGGNDNTKMRHPAMQSHKQISLPLPRDTSYPLVCRWDEAHRFWTIFNRETGAKFRMRFVTSPDEKIEIQPDRASAPELVDVKITDFCPYGCPYCYQGSTTGGLHADHDYLGTVYQALRELEVFEVAIGGGEPTLHPEFLGILKMFRLNGIVPNFTTRNLAWMKDSTLCGPIMENCGAVGFSVDKADAVADLYEALTAAKIEPHRFAVQVVVGAVPASELETIMRSAAKVGFRVVLLGYKTTGRGSEVVPETYDWTEIVSRLRKAKNLPSLGIDTALAATSVPKLEALNIPRWMYAVEEGHFSCYVDAVAKKIGPSSYCDPAQMRPLVKATADEVATTFQTFAR